MLTLRKYKRKPGDEDHSHTQPPKYIFLEGRTTIGRGYGNDIQLLMPWLSRQHVMISVVDDEHFLEVIGKTGVFVNRHRVVCVVLKDYDVITITTKALAFCNKLPQHAGPILSYDYSHTRRSVSDLENVYKSPISRSDLITVSEEVNGNILNETYHVEDFNCTPENSEHEATSSQESIGKSKPCVGTVTDKSDTTGGTTRLTGGTSHHAAAQAGIGTTATAEADIELSELNEEQPHVNGQIRAGAKSGPNRTNQPHVTGQTGADATPGPSKTDQTHANGQIRASAKPGPNKTDQTRVNGQVDVKPGPSKMGRTRINGQLRADTTPGPNGLTSKLDNLNNNKCTNKCTRRDTTGCVGEVEKPMTRQRGKAKRKVVSYNEDSDEYAPPKFAKKKGSASKVDLGVKWQCTNVGKSKSKADRVKNRAELMLVDRWKRPALGVPKPRMVTAMSGLYHKHYVAFKDTETFKVEYNSEGPAHQWDMTELDVNVTVNMALLEYKLRCGSLDPEDLQCLFKIVRKRSCKTDMRDFDKPHTPDDDVVPAVQPPGIALTLKQYQLKTVAWMTDLEEHVGTEWLVSRLLKWEGVNCSLLFDLSKECVYFPPVPVDSTSLKVHAKGGILADEMGLGKTITVLALIVSHKPKDFPRVPEPDGFESQTTYRLPCWATLVVAPSHLTAQWKHESEKHAPDLKVQLITTKPQFEKLSYLDILRADIVVVSVQFLLTNKAYTTMATGVSAETSFINLMRKPGINPLLSNAPNLCHFEWWRVVCDEGHELLTYDTKYKARSSQTQPSIGLTTLEKLRARHRWYVTGTPFPNQHKSLRAALKFLEFSVDDPILVHTDGSLKVDPSVGVEDFVNVELCTGPLWHLVQQTFYVRHTKESICGEYDVPEYIEELLLLTMSDVERGIYDRSVNELERRQLCCHLQIATRLQHVVGVQQKSLDEVRVALIDHTQKEIRSTTASLTRCEGEMQKARTELINEDKAGMRTILQNRIKRLEESLKQYDVQMLKHQGALSYFESIMPKITHSADEPCVICLDPIESLTVTPCGHLFCRKCILPCIIQNSSCPTCRNPLQEKQLIEVKDDTMREKVNKNAEVRKLTEQFGTKMAYLIFYLKHLFRDDPKSRVIIFSQWDPMLHKIGETLNESGLKNVFVKGNVHVRNKAIMSFRKQENVRVIMLSLEHAASGTNLVEATHVILIDPVADTKERAVAIESQAIGRAHRMGQDKKIVVVRMIIKDTIEHELYTRNNDQDVRQVEFNFDDESAFGGLQIVRTVRAIPKPVEMSRPAQPSPPRPRVLVAPRLPHHRMYLMDYDDDMMMSDDDSSSDDDVCSIT